MQNVERNSPVVHALLLGGIALVAAFFLIIGHLATRQSIALRQHEDLVRSLRMVVPARLHDNELSRDFVIVPDENGKKGGGDGRKVYLSRKKGRVTAVAFEKYVNAYARLHLIMGVDASGEILGVRVLEHQETPGLGDAIEVRKSDWIKGFDGLSLSNTPRRKWGVKKDGGMFDQFSGATITPRAVVKAVREGLLFFQRHKAQLLSAPLSDRPEKEAGK